MIKCTKIILQYAIKYIIEVMDVYLKCIKVDVKRRSILNIEMGGINIGRGRGFLVWEQY